MSTLELIALPQSEWLTWGEALYCEQVLARPIAPDDVHSYGVDYLWDDPGDREEVSRERRIEEGKIVELSALGTMVHRQEWSGISLLCNWAPTPFDLDGERYASIDSFHHALKYPAGSADRRACGQLEPRAAKEMARRLRAATLDYAGQIITVGSVEHRVLFARALCSKVAQDSQVAEALQATGRAKLEFPLSYTAKPNVPGLVTPTCLMIERFKRWAAVIRE